MPDFQEKQDERDKWFVRRICGLAENLGSYLQTWVSEETKDLVLQAQLLEVLAQQSSDKTTVQEAILAIRELNSSELDEAINRFKERVGEIEEGLYDDPLESYQHLQNSLAGLERVFRRLLRIRQMVNQSSR